MFQDAALKFSNSQAVAATGAYVIATGTYDLGVARNVGSGKEVEIVFTIETIPTAGTGIEFIILGDTVLPIDASSVGVGSSGEILRTNMYAGQQVAVKFPATMAPYRHIGVGYYCTGAIAGAVISGAVSVDVQTNKANI